MNAQVKAIIDKLHKLCDEYDAMDISERNEGAIEVIDRIETFIDSLPDEPTPSEKCEEVDLEKEIEDFLASEDSTSYENAGAYKVSFKDPKKVARHFYELGKQAKKEE